MWFYQFIPASEIKQCNEVNKKYSKEYLTGYFIMSVY